MADAEFHDPERIELITALRKALEVNVSSTGNVSPIISVTSPAWAYLWLSHIDKLEFWLANAQRLPGNAHRGFLNYDETRTIVLQCEFINLYTFS
jgi:hypothetical protein